jgi:hypothetical protein
LSKSLKHRNPSREADLPEAANRDSLELILEPARIVRRQRASCDALHIVSMEGIMAIAPTLQSYLEHIPIKGIHKSSEQ